MLTVDLGNSLIKACHWRGEQGGFACTARWQGREHELDSLARWLARAPTEPVALSSVAGSVHTERVRALLARRDARLFVDPECGLENRCREPERVGSDRLYAAAGAAALFGQSAIVVDAGTALTVDALLVSGGAGAFLGGAIAPGPALLAEALAAGTARLPRVAPRPGVPALGRVTEEAIAAGVGVGFRGAAAGLVEELAAECGLTAAPVVLTGGAREFLLQPRAFTQRRLEVVPELVHHGLLAALQRAALGLPRP